MSGNKGDTSKIGKWSRIPNLASEIGATSHIFRYIDVSSAFHEVTLWYNLGGKSTLSKCKYIRKLAHSSCIFRLSSNLKRQGGLHPRSNCRPLGLGCVHILALRHPPPAAARACVGPSCCSELKCAPHHQAVCTCSIEPYI